MGEIGIRAVEHVEIGVVSPLLEVEAKKTSNIELPTIEVASFEDAGVEIDLPEAIVSSEVHQLQPIETPHAKNVDQEPGRADKKHTGSDNEAPEMHVLSDSNKTISPTNNLDKSSANDLKKQPIDAEIKPQNIQQAVASLMEAKTNNPRNNKAESKSETSKELSIVESVKVEMVASRENSNPEMSLGFSDENNNQMKAVKLDDMLQDFKPIDHSDTTSTAKILYNASIDADMMIEQPIDMNSIASQIKNAAQTLNVSELGAKSITITLDPGSLGRVEIELHMKDGNIHTIEIKAATRATLELLEKNAHILQDTLNKLEKVSDGNNANLSFSLGKGNDGNNQKQEAQKPTQEFSFSDLKSDSKNIDVELRTLSDYSSE